MQLCMARTSSNGTHPFVTTCNIIIYEAALLFQFHHMDLDDDVTCFSEFPWTPQLTTSALFSATYSVPRPHSTQDPSMPTPSKQGFSSALAHQTSSSAATPNFVFSPMPTNCSMKCPTGMSSPGTPFCPRSPRPAEWTPHRSCSTKCLTETRCLGPACLWGSTDWVDSEKPLLHFRK
jgi:hypothetical protein